ncbi:MAG: fibronectin type III domain-containing protein, partial [Gammaproteobacteria bacterium]|nr:fibronectin type III domain-containing protein [Gammaproteobacteria bacterium]
GGAAVSAYLLRWKPVSAAIFAAGDDAEVEAPKLSYDITGLTNGTTYQAQIAAKNVVGDGEYADAPPAAPFGKPGKPQNVRAATKQSQELAVSWEAPLDDGGAAVSAYLLRWKPVSAAIFAAGDDAEVEAPKLSYDITGLTNGTTYQVQIAAKTAERTGEYSDPALGAAHRGVCGRIPPVRDAIEAALGGLGCAEVSEEKLREVEELNLRNKGISELPENSFAGMRGLVTLDLTENLLAELPLNVFAGLASLRDLILNQTFLTELPAGVFADLGALRRLELKEVPLEGMPLGAFNGLLPGELRIVGMTMPAAPRDLQLTVRNGELRAQWNEVPGAQYQLRWREAGAAEWAREDAAATAATAHTIAGLTNGTRYEVRVAAVPTAPVTINVFRKIWEAAEAQAAPALVAPDAPRAAQTEAGDKRIEVRWQAPLANGGADITGYHVHYKALAGGGMTYMKTAAGSDLVYTITENLENGATYAVKIAAQNRIGIGEFTAAPQATPFTTPDAPAAVALAPDNEELRVTWEAPDDKGRAVSAYHVRWKLAGAADFAAENAAELSAEIFAHAISGLQNGATYEVQVAAENLAGIGDYAAAARGVPRTVPGAPQSVAASPENSQLQISWAAPNEDGGGQVSGYKLRWKLAAATTFAAEDAAEVSADIFAHTISGLQNGELYRVEIAAKNAAGFGAAAAAAGVPRTVPDAPQNLAVNPDNEQLKVSWDAPANDGGDEVSIYLLRWKPVSESEFANAPKIAATTYDITGLENGTTYEVQVSARNAAGDGAYSESARAVPRTVPDAPQNLAVTPGDKQLRVSWAAPAADGGAPVLRYRVRWKLPGDSIDFTDANSRVVDAGVLSHTVAIGRNGTTYEVEVAAQNAAGFGAAVSAESAPRTVPLAPQMIAAAPGNAEITVTWKMPNLDGGAPLLSYRLRWKLAGDSDFAAENAVELPADVLERAITGLNNGATYDVQVAAKNIAGFGEYGESAQATPRDAPGAPKDLAVMPDMGELHITWEAPDSDNGAPVLSYRLRWNLADASDFAAEDMHVVSGDARAHTVTALENGQEYQIEITAGNAAGLGKPAVTQGTPRTVPGLPRDVAVAPYNQELHVTWQAPVENGGAEVRGYSVRWKIAGSAESAHTEAEVTSPTMYTIPGLVNGMTYEVQVAAKNEAGAGEYSAAARAIPRTVPGAPQNLALTPDNAELRVSWDAPDADGGAPVTTYHVRWKTAEGDFAPENAAAFSADVFAGAITGLTNGENYEVKITAENEAGEGEAGIAKAAPRTVPGKPRKVRATASNTDLSITVDWTPPQNNGGAPVTTYLYRWAEKDGSWRPEKIAGGGKARAYTIESGDGLESGGKYQVQIAAVNAAGAGKWADGMFGAGEDKKTFGTPWQFDLDVDGSGAADGRDGTLISRSLNGRALFDSNDEVFAKDAVALAEAAKSKLDSLKIKVVRYEDGGTRLALNVNDVNKTGGEPDHNDGVLIARYLLGLRLDALVAKIDATVNADTIAQNIKPMVESKDLDVNEDGRVTASDGIIVARYLFNVKTEGGLLVSGQAPKAGPNAEEIRAKIRRGRDGLALDIDGNGEVKPDDGTMVFRFLNGQNAEQVFRDADVVNMDELFQKLQSLKPQANSARRE